MLFSCVEEDIGAVGFKILHNKKHIRDLLRVKPNRLQNGHNKHWALWHNIGNKEKWNVRELLKRNELNYYKI